MKPIAYVSPSEHFPMSRGKDENRRIEITLKVHSGRKDMIGREVEFILTPEQAAELANALIALVSFDFYRGNAKILERLKRLTQKAEQHETDSRRSDTGQGENQEREGAD